MLIRGINLAISGHGALRPLGMWFTPFANSVRDTKYRKWCGCVHQLPQLAQPFPPV